MKFFSKIFSGPREKGLRLLEAISGQNIQLTKSLIEKGADVNVKDNYYNGETALFIATRYCKPDVVLLLIEKAADINVKNNSGETPLSLALVNGKLNKSYLNIALLLIDKGADLRERDYLSIAVANDHTDIVQHLIKKGVDVNVTDNFGESLLYRSLGSGQLEIARILIENGADVNAQNKDGETALFLAAQKGRIGSAKLLSYIDIAQLLINKGANLNALDNNATTALHRAVTYGYLDMVRLLINNGADINTNGGNILISAIDYPEIVYFLIEKGINLNSNVGGTALNIAIEKNYLDVAKLLIEKGADINVVRHIYDHNDERSYSYFPLHISLVKDLPDLVNLLIEKGADVNSKDYEGKTALHLIANKLGYREEYLKVVRFLIEKGADIDAVACGKTPLQISVERGYRDLAQILIKAGAKMI